MDAFAARLDVTSGFLQEMMQQDVQKNLEDFQLEMQDEPVPRHGVDER